MAIHQHRFQRRSVALVWVAIFGVTLIGFLGLALDMSLVVLTGNQLESAADAAALAGAMKVRVSDDDARDLAVLTALANKAARQPVQLNRNDDNAPEGDIVLGHYDRDSNIFDPTGSHNAVKVVARRASGSLGGPLPLLFGPIFGVSTTGVSRDAIAMVGGGTGSGAIMLSPDAQCALDLQGTATLNVNDITEPGDNDGVIQVNSDYNVPGKYGAACANNSNMQLEVGQINVYGNANDKLNDIFDGHEEDLNDGCNCTVEDPLGGILEPTDFGPTQPKIDLKGSGHLDLDPGYYPLGISMKNGSIDCAPGLYVIGGPGLHVLGGNFTANGVMFYVIGPSAVVDLGGNGNITISPIDTGNYTYPQDMAQYEGISIFQSRDNTMPASIIGGGNMNLGGTLYFPNNHLSAGGNGTLILGNQLIVSTLTIFGTGDIIVNYDGRNPAPGNKVFLVH